MGNFEVYSWLGLGRRLHRMFTTINAPDDGLVHKWTFQCNRIQDKAILKHKG